MDLFELGVCELVCTSFVGFELVMDVELLQQPQDALRPRRLKPANVRILESSELRAALPMESDFGHWTWVGISHFASRTLGK